jgi:hypothetical protein
MITRAMALKSAVSVPTRRRSQRVARPARSMRRGSATISLAPARTASFTRFARMGCVSVVLVPTARMSLASASSGMLLVIAPLPTVVARPAIVAACQLRAQLSMLFVPTAVRAIFWRR